MANVLRMPGVSADSEEAMLLEWSVEKGSPIRAGEPLAVVETEKANVDIEAETDGTLWRTLAEPGDSVKVGNPIAVLLAAGEGDSHGEALMATLGLAPVAEVVVPAPEIAVETPPAALPQANGGGSARVFSSPLARRIARQSGLAVESIAGTGPGGRIVRADVERAAAAVRPQDEGALVPAQATTEPAAVVPQPTGPHSPAPVGATGGTGYTDIPHTGMRRAVATALTGSKRDAPHFYLTTTCRVDALLELRATLIEQSASKVSINDLFIKAVAKTLRAVPEMNVNWTPDAVRRFDGVDVSVAIASEKGLVTPVLRNADTLSVTEVAARVRDFVERANAGRLKQHELVGGSFTISNLGMFGVEQFSAIINPPQVGILAVGGVVTGAIVDDGEIVVGNTVTVTVSVDHRPVDGVLAARWLARLREFIEQPLTILV